LFNIDHVKMDVNFAMEESATNSDLINIKSNLMKMRQKNERKKKNERRRKNQQKKKHTSSTNLKDIHTSNEEEIEEDEDSISSKKSINHPTS